MFELKKIGFVKRASAWLLDIILLAVLATGFIWIISLICNYSREEQLASDYYGQWEEFRETYIGQVAAHYGYVYIVTDDGYTITKNGTEASLDDVVRDLAASEGQDEAVKEAYDIYLALPSAATVNAQYRYVYTMLFMMVSIGLLLAYLLLEFLVPVLFKNGQTVGKRVFGIGLVRQDCVKVTTLYLFARTLLGKFAIETMFPILLIFLFFFGGLGVLAIILLAALLLLDLILFFATRNKTPIHDLIACTVAVDLKLQVVFDSVEELNEKKAQISREIALAEKEKDRT